MAPRTGADGLIAPLAKATSTRLLCLVLVVGAALFGAGCGGGSSEDSASSTSQSQGQGGSQSASGQGAQENGAQGGGAGSTGNQAAAGEGKQGESITPPKGPREQAPSQKQREEATVASIGLSSPDLGTGPDGVFVLPATYTCDGKDVWPELKWSGLPADTAELALTVVGLEPVDEELFFYWALTGLDPSLDGIRAGQLPKGAVLGKNSFGKLGYSVCPPPGKPESLIFTLYALPSALHASQGFDPAAMREEILAHSGDAGIFAATYKRD